MEKITKKGLKRHLDERVFIGEDGHSMWERLSHDTGNGRMGILRMDSKGCFYIDLHQRESIDVNAKWMKINQVYNPKNSNVIAIMGKDLWKAYQISL